MNDKERQEILDFIHKSGKTSNEELAEYMDNCDWSDEVHRFPNVFNTVKQEDTANNKLRLLLKPMSQEFVDELYQRLAKHITEDLQVNLVKFRQK